MATYVKGNKEQIIRNIALAIRGNAKKIKQLETVQDITITCTSDDAINITAEIYADGIARYLIRGTRSSVTVTVKTTTNELVRKTRGTKPVFVTEIYSNVWMWEILDKVKELLK